MAINNLSTDLFTFDLNGYTISDWGETDPPYSEEPINPSSVMRPGLGGNAVRLDRINPGRRVTINLNPASPDSAYVRGLLESGASVSGGRTQIGTLETAVFTEGVIVNDATIGRGGMSPTDDQYIIEFNNSTITSGSV